jgi:hypothetical protein
VTFDTLESRKHIVDRKQMALCGFTSLAKDRCIEGFFTRKFTYCVN